MALYILRQFLPVVLTGSAFFGVYDGLILVGLFNVLTKIGDDLSQTGRCYILLGPIYICIKLVMLLL